MFKHILISSEWDLLLDTLHRSHSQELVENVIGEKKSRCCVLHRELVMTSTASNSEQVSAWSKATQQCSSVQYCLNIQYKALIQSPLKSVTYMNTGQISALQNRKPASLLRIITFSQPLFTPSRNRVK